MISLAQQRLERMLVGSEYGEAVDPQERGKTQGLQAAQQGLFSMLQQRTVFVWMRTRIGLGHLLKPG